MSSVMESFLYIIDVRSEPILSWHPGMSVRNFAVTCEEPMGGAHAGVDYHRYSEIGLESDAVKGVSAYQSVFRLKDAEGEASLVALFENNGRHGGFGRMKFYALTTSPDASSGHKRFFWEVLAQVFGVRPLDAGREGDLDLVMVQGELTKGYLSYPEVHRYDRLID